MMGMSVLENFRTQIRLISSGSAGRTRSTRSLTST